MNIEDNLDEVINLLKGKRVILIGPAPELQGKNKNEFFKQFDIICGVNQLYNLDDNDFSERIDILFNTTNPQCIEELHNNKNNIIGKNIKYIICTNKWNKTRPININSFNNYCKLINTINPNIKCFNISDVANSIDKIFNISHNSSGAHTGTISLAFLLKLPLKELYIDGFTFYNNNKFGMVHSKGYFSCTHASRDKTFILKNNTHSLSMSKQIQFINAEIKSCNFKIGFDKKYCPLINNKFSD